MIKHNLSERRDLFFVLLAIFITTTTLLSFVIFYSDNNRFNISKEELENRVKDDLQFEESARNISLLMDSVSVLINRFNPDVQAVFLENDIRKILSDMQSEYLKKDYDVRYMVFSHSSVFYDNYFVDRRELKGNLKDIDRIQKLLDDCFMNRQHIQQTMSMQNR